MMTDSKDTAKAVTLKESCGFEIVESVKCVVANVTFPNPFAYDTEFPVSITGVLQKNVKNKNT